MLKVFLDACLERGTAVFLPKEEFHHLFNVLRARPGELVIIINGKGDRATASVQKDQSLLILEIKHYTAPNIILVVSVLKNKAMDYLIRETTAIGVNQIIPLITARTEIKFDPTSYSVKKQHWENIAKEACKQSGNPYLPEISEPLKLEQFKPTFPLYVAALTPPITPLLTRYNEIKRQLIGICIGPEGDFTEAEYNLLKSLPNCCFVSLGENILRSETAATYMVSVVNQIQNSAYDIKGSN